MQRNPERLAVRGPIDTANGFPRWYKDGAGRRLELATDPRDPNTQAMGDLPDPLAPVSFPGNFPDEAFYFLAEAEMPVGGQPRPGRARVVLALEAAFAGTGAVADGQQQVFARIRVRLDGGIPGAAYTFTHPYGRTDPLQADENGRVFVTEDIGAGAGLFDLLVADGEVAPFLRWSADAPPGYLGDGVTGHTIAGSPLGFDFFTVEGPQVGGAGAAPDPTDPANLDKIFTDLFTVQGRISTLAGVEAARAVYTRSSGSVVIDVFARSEPGQTLLAAGTTLTTTGTDYHTRAEVTTVPAIVEVVNATDLPPSIAAPTVSDAVTVLVADYDTAQNQLTVEAQSSDLDDPPTLMVTGIGLLTAGKQVFELDAPPASVEVTSSHGGSHNRHVLVSGPASAPDPVRAAAGQDRVVVAGDIVTLDASASTGAGITYTWAQIDGAPVVLTDSATARATFEAPAAGAFEFEVTVQNAGAVDTDAVSIQIDPAVPVTDTLQLTLVEFRTNSGRWRIEGTATAPLPDRVTVALDGVEVGSGPVDALHEWDIRRTVVPGEAGLTPAAGASVEITSSRGGQVTAPVTIRN
ncbi:PKD domain-containing protein [Winogradskya humida]|uniref:PKD/Chitinase domain-containing protein n=1 Tax=Winogradskya humida TaxID=113566 RepID=A0ABQ3ZIE9_9ACTN|nr:PKD domain-containing protein [Actinoplanes humidus]GIE18332.1 hypothetical protein Ahu01nite_014340 [Actinoplanes humidus]